MVGKPAWNFILLLLPLCIRKRESQFSVEECKHVWVGELQALSSNFCLCLHTTCFRQVWLFLIITIQARGANSPLLSYCLPFYFHPGIMLQWELQIKSLFLHEVLVEKRNKAGFPLWTRSIHSTFYLTLFPPILYLEAFPRFFCVFTYQVYVSLWFFFLIEGEGEDLLLKKCLLYFPGVKYHNALCPP